LGGEPWEPLSDLLLPITGHLMRAIGLVASILLATAGATEMVPGSETGGDARVLLLYAA
jgi:hypothetical protein